MANAITAVQRMKELVCLQIGILNAYDESGAEERMGKFYRTFRSAPLFSDDSAIRAYLLELAKEVRSYANVPKGFDSRRENFVRKGVRDMERGLVSLGI